MSSVLRRKIEAGAGIPPTILQFHEFWDPLQVNVAGWKSETFAREVRAIPETRRVVAGNVAAAQLDGQLSFAFNGRYSPGVCAVAIDDFGAGLNAARRLNQGEDELDGISPLFRKLLFETQAASLWRCVASPFGDHVLMGSQVPVAEAALVAGGFSPDQRYLVVGYKLAANGGEARFWIVFNLDYVMRRAVEFAQQVARQRAVASASASGRGALRESVKLSMITVEGVLSRLPMTIGECSRFEVGQVIALSDVNTASVSLQAETVNGTVDIGQCEMGVWKRQRALKLKTPILEPFTRELAKL